MDLQAIVWCATGLDVLQPDETANAVIDMHHQVAGVEARHLGDEILGALGGSPRPHQAVAEDVLLADQRNVAGLEAAFEAQHGERHLRFRQLQRLEP